MIHWELHSLNFLGHIKQWLHEARLQYLKLITFSLQFGDLGIQVQIKLHSLPGGVLFLC